MPSVKAGGIFRFGGKWFLEEWFSYWYYFKGNTMLFAMSFFGMKVSAFMPLSFLF